MKRGEVYWVAFDPSIGEEIKKTRPAVVISNDIANRAINRFLVVPLTSNTSRVFPGETLIHLNGVRGKAMADQLNTASRLRFQKFIGVLSQEDMKRIERVVLIQLGFVVGVRT